MNSDCIYPHIQERLIPVHQDNIYESEYSDEQQDFAYEKWSTKQESISLVQSLNAIDFLRAEHSKELQAISASDLIPNVEMNCLNDENHWSNNHTADHVPEYSISDSSPPAYSIYPTSWGNADDIPTRASSPAPDDFPPLVRCCNMYALGYSEEHFIDLGESDLSDWSIYSLPNADSDENGESWSQTEGELHDSSLFLCTAEEFGVYEKEDDNCWASNSPANTATPLRSP